MAKAKNQTNNYVDILSDFGWKYYFGREENKINLINFLNSLLEGEHVIEELYYSNVELGVVFQSASKKESVSDVRAKLANISVWSENDKSHSNS